MAQSLSDTFIPEDYDYKTPEHLIIWLDDHIGDPERYHPLKRSFSSNIDPRNQAWTTISDQDIDNLLRIGEAMPVSFGGVRCLLLAFTNPDLCYQAFQLHQDKRILFITSGHLGRSAVPPILEDFRQVFTDPATKDPYSSVYVFCLNIERNCDWAQPHCNYIQMFDHEADLLSRMTLDMATYYSTKGDRQHEAGHLQEALRFYLWSKKLFRQYEKIQEPCKKDINKIDAKIQAIKDILQPPQENSDNENYGEPVN